MRPFGRSEIVHIHVVHHKMFFAEGVEPSLGALGLPIRPMQKKIIVIWTVCSVMLQIKACFLHPECPANVFC